MARAAGLDLARHHFSAGLAVLLLITTRWRVWETNATRQSTDDAYLQSDLTPIAAHVAGYIRRCRCRTTSAFSKGQLIAQLVDDDYRATVAQLTAASRPRPRRSARSRRSADCRMPMCRPPRPPSTRCWPTWIRTRAIWRASRMLQSTGSSSTEAGEKLQTHARSWPRSCSRRGRRRWRPSTSWPCSAAQQAQAEAALAAQQATLDVARINLGYTRILAPEDGVIGQRQVKPGQLVGVGGQITTLTPLPIWVLANYKETQLTHMDVGAPAEIAVDTFPGHTLRGKVLAFAPGAGSQFALLPPDNATGNFTKVVQRVAVKISIDDADGLTDRLRPGMSVVATVDTRRIAGASDCPAPAARIATAAPRHSVAGAGGRAAGHLRFHRQLAAFELRSGRYPRRGACQFRSGRLDHHGAVGGADADRARGDLAGRRVRHAPGADGGGDRLCRGLPDPALCAQYPDAAGLQFVGGLASGFFIPLTLGFILRNMPPKVWAYGIALYALNLEVSLNISASLEGWYIEHLSWRWIFWQNVPLAIGMWYCLNVGIRPGSRQSCPSAARLVRAPVRRHGLGLIYAALDQGNRLDWQNSALVWALMARRRRAAAGLFRQRTAVRRIRA